MTIVSGHERRAERGPGRLPGANALLDSSMSHAYLALVPSAKPSPGTTGELFSQPPLGVATTMLPSPVGRRHAARIALGFGQAEHGRDAVAELRHPCRTGCASAAPIQRRDPSGAATRRARPQRPGGQPERAPAGEAPDLAGRQLRRYRGDDGTRLGPRLLDPLGQPRSDRCGYRHHRPPIMPSPERVPARFPVLTAVSLALTVALTATRLGGTGVEHALRRTRMRSDRESCGGCSAPSWSRPIPRGSPWSACSSPAR